MDLSSLHVAKLGYSANPWRIIDPDGQELWHDQPFDHPTLGRTVIGMPVCFPRKRDAVAWLATHTDPVDLPTPDSNGEPPPVPAPGEPEAPR